MTEQTLKIGTTSLASVGAETAAALTTTASGARISLRSINYGDRYIRHSGYRGRIDLPGPPPFDEDATWLAVPSVDGTGNYSLESVNYPYHLLRHRNFEIWLDEYSGTDLFKKDASFIARPGLIDGHNYISFESVNYPNHYIRHSGFQLFIHKDDSSTLFKLDATFQYGPGRS